MQNLSPLQAMALNVNLSIDEGAAHQEIVDRVKAAILSARPADLPKLFPHLMPPAKNMEEVDHYVDSGGVVSTDMSGAEAEDVMRQLGMMGTMGFDDMTGGEDEGGT